MNTIKKTKKNLKFNSIAGVLSIMLIVIVILINVAASFLKVSFDMTPSRLYTMDKSSTDYLSNLEKEVDLYFLMDIDKLKNDPNANTVLALINLLEQYDSYEKINLIDVDYDENPEIINQLNPDNYLQLSQGDIIVKCGDIVKKVKATEIYQSDGSYDSYGNYIQKARYFYGENMITGAIKAVVENITPVLYFLTGHGEKSLSTDYTTFTRDFKNINYDLKELNLASMDQVPDDAGIVIVAAPQMDITDDEKDKLNKYLDKGGNLSLLMSPTNNGTIYDNLTEIMNDYCLGMDYVRAYETDDSRHISGDKYQIMVDLVDIRDNSDSGQTENLTDLTSILIDDTGTLIPYMPESRTFFDYKGENYAQLNICPLLETYDTINVEQYGGKKENPEDLSNMNNQALWVAAYSENPERNYSKLVVMGNAEFIDDEHLSVPYTVTPFLLYNSTISWMANSDVDMGIPSREQSQDYMIIKSQEDTNLLIVILCAAPIVVASAGIFIWLKRRNS